MDSNIFSSHHVTGVSLMIKLGNLKKVKGEESLDNTYCQEEKLPSGFLLRSES